MSNTQALQALIFRLILDIAPEADIESLDPDEDFREELDLDSIDFMNLLEALTKETGVTIPESDYDQLSKLSSMLNYIESKQ